MGYAGFRNGKVKGDNFKAGSHYVPDSQWIGPLDVYATSSGIGIGNVPSLIELCSGVHCYSFDASAQEGIAYVFKVPDCIEPNTKINLNYFWTTSGSEESLHTVVWDSEYVTAGIGATISGVGTNVTTSVSGVSGAKYVARTIHEIPTSGVAAGDVVRVLFYRDADETADNNAQDAALLGIEITYI